MKKFDGNKELDARLEFERGWCDQVSWVAPGPWDPVCDLGVPQDGCFSEVSNRLEGREVAGGVPGAGARASFFSGGGFVRVRFFLSVLVVVLLAVALAVVDGLSGPVDSAAALNGKSPGFLGSPFGGGGLWGSSSSGGSPASSSASCPSGYSLRSDNLACEKVESRSASLSCPSGSSQFSLGIGAAWGCKRDLGAASTSYSCSQGVLVTVSNGFQGGRACKITSTSTESRAASASCSPRGSPTSCRYTNQVLTRQSQGASASCILVGRLRLVVTPLRCRLASLKGRLLPAARGVRRRLVVMFCRARSVSRSRRLVIAARGGRRLLVGIR